MKRLAITVCTALAAAMTLSTNGCSAAGAGSYERPFEYFDFQKSMDVTEYGVPSVINAHGFAEMPVAYSFARPDYRIEVRLDPAQYLPSVFLYAVDAGGRALDIHVPYIRCFVAERPTVPAQLEKNNLPPSAIYMVWHGTSGRMAECEALDPLESDERYLSVYITDPTDDRPVAEVELPFDIATNGSVTIPEPP